MVTFPSTLKDFLSQNTQGSLTVSQEMNATSLIKWVPKPLAHTQDSSHVSHDKDQCRAQSAAILLGTHLRPGLLWGRFDF